MTKTSVSPGSGHECHSWQDAQIPVEPVLDSGFEAVSKLGSSFPKAKMCRIRIKTAPFWGEDCPTLTKCHGIF